MIFKWWHPAAMLGLAAMATAAPPHAEDAKLTDVVFANAAISLSFSASYLAEDLGIFKSNGLNVKTVVIPGVGAINAVISGSADFTESSSTSFTRAAARGQRLLAIAETSDLPAVQVALRKDVADAGGFDPKAPFAARMALLRGRVIAVDATGSLVDAYLIMGLKRAGIDPQSAQIPTMQPANMLAAFATKQIDGFAEPPPWPLEPVMQGKAVLLASGSDGDPADIDPFANGLIVTRPQTCQQRRPICEAIGHSFVAAEVYLHDHPAESLTILKRRFATLDDKVLAAAFDVVRKISPNPPRVTTRAIANTERLNIEAGLLKPADKLASYDGLMTDEFLK